MVPSFGAAHGMHQMRDHRRRCQAELTREVHATRHESCFALRGAKLYRVMPMTERPRATHKSLASLTAFRVIAGVAVFALGVVAGVVFAAWLMPPS